MSSINDRIASAFNSINAGRYSERHGFVTSFDPNNFWAQAVIMPEGIPTGWMQIETPHIGNGYGMVVGPQPGGTDGSGGGDQIMLSFHGGDIDAPKLKQRLHNKDSKPPTVKSGEMMLWTKFKGAQSGSPSGSGGGQEMSNTGQKIFFKGDGSISTEDGGGAKRTMDGKANYTVESGNQQQDNKIEHNILNQQPASAAESTPPADAGNPSSDFLGQAQQALGGLGGLPGGLPGSGGGSTGSPNAGNAGTLSGGSDVLSTLTGLLAQAAALHNANAGLPGIVEIGQIIANMSGEILLAGGDVSTASAVTNLGSQMAAGGVGIMGGIGAVIGQLQGLMSNLQGMMGDAAGMVKHYTKLDNQKGTKAAAFQEQHWTTWDQQGVTHSSSKKSTTRAPQIQHQGQVQNTDSVVTAQQDIAGVQETTSDVRLKIKIKDAPSMLDKIMALRVRTFEKYPVQYSRDGKQSIGIGPPRPMLGLIAQEVREVLPELIHGDEATEFLSLDEGATGASLIKAFQEFVYEVREKLEIRRVERTPFAFREE